MGICEGPPRSIIPDHLGRADYHGASINQAARYMDAAAHGGMIALEVCVWGVGGVCVCVCVCVAMHCYSRSEGVARNSSRRVDCKVTTLGTGWAGGVVNTSPN